MSKCEFHSIRNTLEFLSYQHQIKKMTSKYDLESRDPISSEFAYDTFSKAGFKPVSSICEIIDNSIEAEADEILIKFEWNPAKTHGSYRRIKKFIFIDNGYGMDEKRIYDYFVATESDKRNKDEGIGKFGVGAYMSGISQAAKCEVHSKTSGGKWLYTILEKGAKIPKPVFKSPPKEYNKFEHGTIVIWSETYSPFTDNDINSDDTGDNLVFQLGRTYRKFLTDEIIDQGRKVQNKKKIHIQIRSENENPIDVIPYDPTFVTYNPKQGDKEPRMISTKVKLTTPEHTGVMYITFSFFPEEWWIKGDKPGLLAVNRKERKIIEAGISLVREKRELYFGSYPGGPIKITGIEKGEAEISDIDRWLGIEVAFDRDSDEIFGVEFNKTRIIMEKYARKKISEAISPTVSTHRRNYESKRTWYKDSIGGTTTTGGKGGTEVIHGSTPTPTYSTEEEKKLKEFAQRYKDDNEDLEEVYQDLLKGYHVSLKFKQNPNAPFVEFAYEGDSVLVMYNMDHPFMIKFFEILEKIGQKLGAEPGKALSIPEMELIRALLDILLASYGFAKTTLGDLQKTQIIDTTLNQFTTNWGISANTLAKNKLLT